MKRFVILPVALSFACLLVLVIGAEVKANSADEYHELSRVMDSAKILEAQVFAPKMFAKASKKFVEAKQAMNTGRDEKTVYKKVAEAREYLENSLKAAEVGKLSLEQYLAPRKRAKAERAVSLVAELYFKAEQQFIKATAKVESGDVKNGIKEAGKSSPLFDYAELAAIKKSILGAPDKLIAKAGVDDAVKFAPSTLDKARTARTKADLILTKDRYAKAEAQALADLASYEARHASNISLSVRALNRNDQAWEKLMLLYEIQMNRIGASMELSHLPFDNGPFAAADTLIDYIGDLKSYSESVQGASSDLSATMVASMHATLSDIGAVSSKKDPVELAKLVRGHASRLFAENDELDAALLTSEEKLAALDLAFGDVQASLQVREDRENKLIEAKRMLNPSEGEVLFNSSNDIVLRLAGVSFDVGKTDIKDEHVALLEKVKHIIEMFPDGHLVIEGHTDASGDGSSNMTLSEKRAFAVMQYIRQSLMLPADRINSMGFGSDRPIASNQTVEGRSKNRRIDVLIMQ